MLPAHVEGIAMKPTAPTAQQATEPQVSFKDVFRQIASSVDRGEQTVSAALRVPAGADDDRRMLALQAGVYRYVEAVELCSRIVDRSTSAVKTVLQSQ